MGDYIYYPGCSLEGSARAYASSLSAIVAPLGVKLHEIDDWNCCGATEYMTLSPLRGHALIARNLALAEAQRDGASTLVAPCSACYVNLAKTDRYYRESSGFAELVNKALSADNLHYDGGALHVRHLLEVLVDDVGVDEIATHVTRPLKGLRVAPYLGCLVSRPDLDHRWGDHEQPHALDRLMTQISPETAWELIRRLVEGADQAHADVMVTVCPMCQMNVDAYQGEMDRHFKARYRVPILFFTQLMGLAFGFEAAELGIGSEVVDAGPALSKLGIEVPIVRPDADATPDAAQLVAAGAHARPRRPRPGRGPELPMPHMPEPGEDEL